MDRKNTLRSTIATALVVAMLVAVPFVLTTIDSGGPEEDHAPMLYFDGMALNIDSSGNIQALMDVYVKNALMTGYYNFDLIYDSDLIVPSDYATNAPVTGDGTSETIFAYDPELFRVLDSETGEWVPTNPFETTSSINNTHYCIHSSAENSLTLSLNLDKNLIGTAWGDDGSGVSGNIARKLITEADVNNSFSQQYAYYLVSRDGSGNEVTTAANTSVKLGTLSFRVNSFEALSELVSEYGNKKFYWYKGVNQTVDAGWVAVLSNKTNLNWSIMYYKDTGTVTLPGYGSTDIFNSKVYAIGGQYDEGAAVFSYNFGAGLISAEPLREEIAINAYQAYTYPGSDGEAAYSNLAIALGKYAPTVVARYADSTVRNYTLNWGAANTADRTYDFTLYRIETDNSGNEISRTEIPRSGDPDYADFVYDQTGGKYVAAQYFYYPTDDGYERYPTPIEVYLTVTPVTAVSVSADNLTKNYVLGAGGTIAGVNDYADLDLPTEIRINTDVVSGAPSLFLDVGDGGDLPAWNPTALGDLTATDSTYGTVNWPNVFSSTDTTGGITLTNYYPAEYGFTLGALSTDTATADSAANRLDSAVYGTEMQAKYPWLTVNPSYEIDATRTVYPTGTDIPGNDYLVVHYNTTANDYTNDAVADSGDYTEDLLTLRLAMAPGGAAAFDGDEIFRVRMPNGVEILAEIFAGAGDWVEEPREITTENEEGNSVVTYRDDGSSMNWSIGYGIDFGIDTMNGMVITIIPGVTSDNAVGEHSTERAELRRWINLGGYFEIAVCENAYATPGNTTSGMRPKEEQIWSEFFPVYVSPRTNYYEEDKTYNFIGLNADLINYYSVAGSGTLGDTLTLPSGDYQPIDLATNTHSSDENGAVYESYGVMTTYDPLTGDQPGVTYTFTVDPLSDSVVWGTVVTDASNSSATADTELTDPVYGNYSPAKITRYNAEKNDDENNYADAAYAGYGEVKNKSGISAPEEDTNNDGEIDGSDQMVEVVYEPTLRFAEDNAEEKPLESVRLIYEGSAPQNITENDNGEVTLVTFDTQTEGYTVRQSFVLTLVNEGSTDIDGIYINSLLDLNAEGYNEYYPDTNVPYGGHFEITSPPASFLAAGSKTTFTVTYVYDLRAVIGGDVEYLDKLYICSNAYGLDSPLKTFDANFRVTSKEVNRVTVIVVPTFGTEPDTFVLGEAGVIVGPSGSDMDYTYTSTMRAADSDVYIGTFPYDEYEVKAVFSPNLDSENNPITQMPSPNDDVYTFTMPTGNVTVYVVIGEPTISKLRPGTLEIYADETNNVNICEPDNLRTMWKKEFGADTTYTDPLEQMQYGSAYEEGYDGSTAHYLVVLDRDDEYVQAFMVLRQVVALAPANDPVGQAIRDQLAAIGYADSDDYINDNIKDIGIKMLLYSLEESGALTTTPGTVYDNSDAGPVGSDDGATAISATSGDTSVPTSHRSTTFAAPEVGGREWLVITLSYNDGTSVERSYYIEIVRRPSHSVTLGYGNSPVGMIYNTGVFHDGTVLTTDGKAAIEEFVATRGFGGAAMLPYAFTYGNGVNDLSTDYTYNREAWIPHGELYDPDSLTYTASYAIGSGGEDIDGDLDLDEFDEYEVYQDLDLDPHSLFVMIGEDFVDPGLLEIKDSSMREIDPSRVRVYIDDIALMGSGATETERFAGATATDIDLGTLETAIENEGLYKAAFWQATHSYSVMQHFYDGEYWDVYSVDGIDHTGEPNANQNMYFEYIPGKFYPLSSPQAELTDADKLAALEPVIVDTSAAVKVRPGVYDLIYEFDDFDSAEGDHPIQVVRKLIVLGPVGDADADGTAHNDASASAAGVTSDEMLIENRVEDPLGCEVNYNGANAFKFRTVDANNDRNVNNIDANELHSNLDGLMQFYEPVHYIEGGYKPSATGEVSP